jgi:hypothetical protein
MAYLDSSFLDDTSPNGNSMFKRPDIQIAKGKLSYDQSERLLGWYDQGMSGNLPYHNDENRYIPKELFFQKLKNISDASLSI